MSEKKILIIQTAFIGDVVLTTPLIRATALQYKNAKIDIIVTLVSADILENNPFIRNIIQYDKKNKKSGINDFIKLVKTVKQNHYDLVISPHRSLRSALIAWFSGAPQRIGFNTSAAPYLYTHKVIYHKNLHEIERNLELLQNKGKDKKTFIPEIFTNDNDENKINSYITEASVSGSNFIALAPGSVWATKRWPKQYFQKLIKLLSTKNNSIFLIGGIEDQKLCQEISLSQKNVYNTAGLFTLKQTTALLKKCKFIVTNDSAPLHLGVAAKIPVYAIFGPTVPAFGFYPYGENHVIIEHKLECRPCGIHGGPSCPIKTHDCMIKITPEEVYGILKNEVQN